MYKKIILMIFTIAMLSSLAYGDMEVNMTVQTEGNINSTIIQVADGNISTDLYCNGQSCTTNVFGGEITVPENQSFDYNDYTSYFTTVNERSTSGLSFNSFMRTIVNSISDYMNGKKSNSNGWKFWSLLDSVFVNHAEFQPSKNNINYLADEVDVLKAKNQFLIGFIESEYNIDKFYNDTIIECYAAINKAKRTGIDVTSENGWMVKLDTFGETCIKLQ